MRHLLRGLILMAMILLAPLAPAQDASDLLQEMLETSLRDRRGIVLYVNGTTLGGGVVRFEKNQWVELRSPEFGRIIVRMDKVDAAALR